MKTKIAILLSLMTVSLAYSQEKLTPLKVPASPASSVLGLQPTVVLTPKSYDALETALYSNFLGDNGVSVPDDFALEFTPYWTKDHGLTIYDYLYAKSLGEQLKRNTSFSVATTQNLVLNDSVNSTAIALGVRTSLYFPNKSDKQAVDSRLSELRAGQRTISAIGAQVTPFAFTDASFEDFWGHSKMHIESFLKKEYPNLTTEETNQFLKDLFEKGKEMGYNSGDNDTFLAAFINTIDEKLNGEQLYVEFEDYIKNRYGLTLDIAYANMISFPTNDFEYSILPKQSIWVTPAYKFKDEFDFLKVLAIVRYEWYDTDYYARYFENTQFYSNNLDYGLSAIGEFNKFSVQLELIGRSSSAEIPSGFDAQNNPLFRKVSDSDFQYIATFSYNLTEQINLSYSLGNRFEPVANDQNTLISLLGLNFGFGAPSKKDLGLVQFKGE